MSNSADGKRANLRNLRHGLRTRAVLPWEDLNAYGLLQDELDSYLKPTSPAELEVVRALGGIMWRLRRVALAEAAHFERAQPSGRTALSPGDSAQEDAPQGELVDPGSAALRGIASERLGLIGRYEASLQRAARRQLFLLSAMRRLRGGQLIDHENMEGGERQSEE